MISPEHLISPITSPSSPKNYCGGATIFPSQTGKRFNGKKSGSIWRARCLRSWINQYTENGLKRKSTLEAYWHAWSVWAKLKGSQTLSQTLDTFVRQNSYCFRFENGETVKQISVPILTKTSSSTLAAAGTPVERSDMLFHVRLSDPVTVTTDEDRYDGRDLSNLQRVVDMKGEQKVAKQGV